MPELAEVAYFVQRWNPGLGQRILEVQLHPRARIFRGQDTGKLVQAIGKTRLVESMTRGKQMLFCFEKATLGLHLGMTGELRCEPGNFQPAKHDHLVLKQRDRSLVFSDPRLFGRVLFEPGPQLPEWWQLLPPDLLGKAFLPSNTARFLQRRARAPIKGVLLMQECFPGIGNWMADEILWRSGLHPAKPAGQIEGPAAIALHHKIRKVCREAMDTIGKDWSDPPDSWLFNHRWKRGGHCPRCLSALLRETIAGRTTCWCPSCQQG